MSLNDALRRFREDQFNDRDVTRCTELSVRGWRELIKRRLIRTSEARGPGRVRQCDAATFKRTAVIAALNRTGLSLAVSGRIAYFYPYHTLLFTVCDPNTILLQRWARTDPATGLPPAVKRPRVDWFDPAKPAKADPRTDWQIEICEGRFVRGIYPSKDGPPVFFGDLRNEGSSFVAWFPFLQRDRFTGNAMQEIARGQLPHKFIDWVAEWEDPLKWRKELGELDYQFERHDAADDPLCEAAVAAAESPVIKTTINVTLTIKKALRRYLGIEPVLANSE
jgi:hypothetical protein